MIVCMPTIDGSGLKSRLSPHFGSAPWFTIVSLPSGAIRTVENQHAVHEPGACTPTASLAGLGVNAVLCRGLGGRAMERLRVAGISVLMTDEWRVEGALEALASGRVRPFAMADACQEGHAHGPGHSHGPGDGQGHGHSHGPGQDHVLEH